METRGEQSDAGEPVTASVASAIPVPEVPDPSAMSAQSRKLSGLSFSGAGDGSARTASPLRRGFLRQLLSRFSSGEG